MNTVFSEAELSSLNDRIDTLRSSARRTLPMFLIGVLATLVAAAVAIFYIMTLSNDLRDARAALRRTEDNLAVAQGNLAVASAALREVQIAVRSSPSGSPKTVDANRIAGAISDVSRSQSELKSASASIREAASKLPEESLAVRQQGQPVAQQMGWFAVIGSYALNDAGLAEAVQQQQRARTVGLCTELWRTKISGNYAVVVGSRTDRNAASSSAERARKAGLAKDAFAQPDRDWTKLPQSPSC